MITGTLILLPFYSTLVFVTATLLYLPVGISLEEQKLVREFGEQYLQYKKEVKMLIPYLF
jgi:protein-S-isoprenylcysteine O-methyltransferase Ste14